MRELGHTSVSLHFEIGKYVAEHGVDMLFTLGELGAEIAVGAISSGVDKNNVFVERDIENIDHFAEKIRSSLTSGDAILFKASRALALERIIEKIF
jgi:UDP-N-acetylmuramoyl-tripeptide--D-alanyl-D-alanine ligase